MYLREDVEHICSRQFRVLVKLQAKVYFLDGSIEFASSSMSTADLPPCLRLIWLYGCSEDIR